MSGLSDSGVDVTLDNGFYVHSIGLTTANTLNMAASGTGVVWSPRSNISLYGMTANVVMMRNMGIKIAL